MSEVTAPIVDGQGTAAPAAPTSTGAALAATSAPAAPAVPTSQQVTAPPAVPPAPAAPSWLGEADETTVGYLNNKGWTDPKQILDGYRNLEKLLGADKANNAVIVPKEGADAKEWASVYDRLGRPSAPDGYKVEVPQGGDKTMHEASLSKFHELGLSKTQGETLMNWYNEQVMSAGKAQVEQQVAAFQEQDTALRSEWGQAYTQNLAQAQAGARGLNLDAATIDKLSDSLGHKATMNLLQRVGAGMREDSMVTADNPTGFGNVLTPGQAKAQIQSLMTDRDFVAKYRSGDSGARAKMDSLHRWAYPE